MNFTTRETICQALGYKNIFTPAAVEKYLRESSYLDKEKWVASIQKGKTCFYVTSLSYDISERRRANFRLLSLLQVREFENTVRDAQLAQYLKMQLALHDGANIGERQKFQDMVNNHEVKLMRSLAADQTSPEDIRIFLTTAMIFSDRNFLYDNETKVCLSYLLSLLN